MGIGMTKRASRFVALSTLITSHASIAVKCEEKLAFIFHQSHQHIILVLGREGGKEGGRKGRGDGGMEGQTDGRTDRRREVGTEGWVGQTDGHMEGGTGRDGRTGRGGGTGREGRTGGE